MITLQAQKFTPVSFECKRTKNDKHNAQKGHNTFSNPIDKTLLALAIIGMASLQSCTKNEIFYPEDYQTKSEWVDENYIPQIKDAPLRCENILKAMGVLPVDKASLDSIKTVSCVDTAGTTHYIKPTFANEGCVKMVGLDVTRDYKGEGEYNAYAVNASNGGLDIFRFYSNGDKEKINFVINRDGSVTESLYLDDDIMVERSVFRKKEDGILERTYSNDSIAEYSNFSIKDDLPHPITFNASVEDWYNRNVNANV